MTSIKDATSDFLAHERIAVTAIRSFTSYQL